MKEQKLLKLGNKQKWLVAAVIRTNIISHKTEQEAVSLTQHIKLANKDLKTLKDFLLKHPKEQIKEINEKFKSYEETLKNSEIELKNKITNYQIKQNKIINQEEERIREKQEKKYQKQIEKAKKKGKVAPPPPIPIKVKKEKVDGLQIRKRWTFDKENFKIKKIPEIFNGVRLKILDIQAVQKLVDAGVRKIPGIPIFQKTISAIGQAEDDDI